MALSLLQCKSFCRTKAEDANTHHLLTDIRTGIHTICTCRKSLCKQENLELSFEPKQWGD